MASASVVLAYGFGVFHLLKVMDGVRELVKAMSRYKDYREAATRQSNAELATVEQFESAGLLGEHGIVLGSISDQAGKKRLLKYDGKNAITVASPPEGKKSTSVFMPTLLATAEGRGLGHSAIVFDPAAEIYSVTQEALRKENDVYCLSPWPERIAAQLLEATGEEIPVHDSGLNYWSDLNIEDEDPRQFRSVLKRKAELLIPCNPRDDEKDRFFKMAGRRLFIYFALYCIAAEKAPTLAMIRSMLNEGPEAMQKRFAEGSESTALNGLLAEEAGGLLDIASGAVEQHAGGLGNALNAIDLFDGYSVFADHFRPDGLDPGVLKREKPAIVFVIYPL
ncbi:MAG: type IV secretory system conjugative DNA transfer family protein, partial [Planctomycetota bacterium]